MPKPEKPISFVNEVTSEEFIEQLKSENAVLVSKVTSLEGKIALMQDANKNELTVEQAKLTSRTYDRFEAILSGFANKGRFDNLQNESELLTALKHAWGIAKRATQVVVEDKTK